MSFGGGFGSFGSNNNSQTSGGFGGFGSNSNTNQGFGSNAGGFGQNNTAGGGLFGGNSSNTTSGGFGSGGGAAGGGGGFGSGTGGFGNKPAFGSPATTTGGLFGSANANNANNTTTSAFGGFGSANNNTTATSAFGGGNSNTGGGGLFGNTANKPGFGATNTTPSLFGANTNTNTTANTGTGFGGFGSTNLLGGGGSAGAGDPPGTGITPFQAFTEKEPNSSTNQTNAFQNVCFQDPYKKWSGEELRLADYAQGRRNGNASGAGAFGIGSGFGGLGSNNPTATANNQTTGGFGSATNNATGGLFGANNTTANTGTGFGTGAFGAANNPATNNAGGGLFGNANASKPGLFGNTTQNQTGGMFGNNQASTGFGATANNAGTLFGAANNNVNNPAGGGGGGLFGSNANQAKPQGTGFSFGNTNTAPSTGFGSGTTNNAFGSMNNNASTGTGLFGNTANTAQPSGGLFGNTNNAQQNATPSFGGGFGQQNQAQQTGGLFGNTQQKPAAGGLFGSTPTNTNTGGGLFGNTANQQQGGGLFGSNPAVQTNATTGGGGTGGGLFGGLGTNTQNQQAAGTGLFGAANNQQKPGSLFGGGGTTNTGTGLFGAQTNQAQGSSLFGAAANNNQQQQNTALGASLLGNSQMATNAPQGLTANLSDISAYGSPALFANLGGNEVPNPGPLAVPLGGNPKPRRPGIFPFHKFTPAASTRFNNTPPKRGFGFSYSGYGTPTPSGSSSGTATTTATLGRSVLGTANGSTLGRSVSASSLRRNYNTEDSILIPGAFSNATNNRWFGSTGSKKLIINRDLRSDLFSTPSKDKSADSTGSRKLSKRVSFDTSLEDEEDTPVRAALPAPGDVPSSPAETTQRQAKAANNVTNGTWTPEMEQVRDRELGVVQEEDQATPDSQTSGFDNAPGDYWMEPAREELQNMNRVQRQKVPNFTVGRENVGSITFKIPVDISSIDLDEICGGIVQLEPRSATVYPVAAKKPSVGKGLNVPARISLEQSWPRGTRDKRIANDPKRFNKHVDRLKRIVDTTYESYDADTGVWTFSVEHFTTYGLDDSDDDSDYDITQDMPMPVIPQSLAMNGVAGSGGSEGDVGRRQGLPGAFDEHEREELCGDVQKPGKAFLGVSSADSAAHDVKLSLEKEHAGDGGAEYEMSEDEDLTRSSIGQHLAAEQDDCSSEGGQETKKGAPGGILRARMRAMKHSIGPVKLEVADGNDWMGMLRKTISPAKRDRQYLRELVDSPAKKSVRFGSVDDEEDAYADADADFRKSSIWSKSISRPDRMEGFAASTMGTDQGRGFATSIDLMNSLFEKPKSATGRQRLDASPDKGFPKWPYERQDKILTAEESERAFHNASKPTWGLDETLVLTRAFDGSMARRSVRDRNDIIAFQRTNVQSERQDLYLARFTTQSSKEFLHNQDLLTEIYVRDGVPAARLQATSLQNVFHHRNMHEAASIHEKQVWDLASILFDPVVADSKEVEHLVRRKKLSHFWTDLVEQATLVAIGMARTSEAKAVACLAGHRVTEACKYMLDSKNFRLGTLVSLIGRSDATKKDMKEQLEAWQDSKMLSEFSEAIRTIYELLSGNVCVCEGLKGVPLEDRLESFVISAKFGLDWRQAFGLRLWYGVLQQDDLAMAVYKFKDDIEQDREGVPQPWYVEQDKDRLWEDGKAESRQDLLWGLLQLYADPSADLEAILGPGNSQLSPLDERLRWQLGLALTGTGRVGYGADRAAKVEAATLAYATQLTSGGDWLEAIFVLLHLERASARKKAIQEQLCRHAGLIGSESGATFSTLTDKFRIPAEWVWEALALYMRSVCKDARAEVQCLLRAGSLAEAHRVLVAQVAPQAIVSRDYEALASLLSHFQERQGVVIPGWTLGGEIYGWFLQLVQCRSKGESAPGVLLDRLLAGLNAMKEGAEEEMVQYAAVSDMADETAREIIRQRDVELRSRILHLPLTQDRLLAYSVDLSLERYREVMSR